MTNPNEATTNESPTGGVLESDTDFSLVLGGPLYQLFLRTRLARWPLKHPIRRILWISLICWFPLFLLSAFSGHLLGGIPVPFLLDLDTQVRFLVALPMLIAGEITVHNRMRAIVPQFLERDIVSEEDRPRFGRIVSSILSLRDSAVVEAVLALCVITVGLWAWRAQGLLGVVTWYTTSAGSKADQSAGYWYAFVSLPILRFITLRWYFRLFLWYRFLWLVRQLPLRLNLLHPDRAGGLGFVSGSIFAFMPMLVAHTVVLGAYIADRIFHAGARLPAFKMDILGVVIILMLLVLAPLTFFSFHLVRAHLIVGREYGALASRYVNDFRRKWLLDVDKTTQPLLGSSDIQSLADLGNAYSVVSEMRFVPVDKPTLIRLAVMLVLPLLPLILTMFPLSEMVDRLIKMAL